MAVVREMSVTYGAQAIPGTAGGAAIGLHKVHKLVKGPENFEVEFDITVDAGGSESVMAAAALALEATFTTRRLALTVDLNGNTALSLSDATRSGLDISPTIEKVGDVDPPDRFDTNTSRLYRIRIIGGLPALGVGNRLRFGFDVSFTASRRTDVTVTGTYTATAGGGSASAAYLALIDGRVAPILSTLGGTFEVISERFSPDDVDGFADFERVYREILVNQSVSLVDNPAIIDPNLSITRRDTSDEGTGEGTPLRTLDAVYDTSVDVTINSDLINVWDTISKPFVIQQLELVAAGSVAITQIEPRFDFYRHTISAMIVAQTVGEGQILTKTVETLDEVDYGKIVRDVWPLESEVPDDEDAESPIPAPAHVYQAARVISREVITTTEETTAEARSPRGANRNSRVGAQEGQAEGTQQVGDATFRSVRMTRSTRSKRKDRGITSAASTIPVLERIVVETFRIVVALDSASAGAAAGDAAGAGGLGAAAGAGGRGGRT